MVGGDLALLHLGLGVVALGGGRGGLARGWWGEGGGHGHGEGLETDADFGVVGIVVGVVGQDVFTEELLLGHKKALECYKIYQICAP